MRLTSVEEDDSAERALIAMTCPHAHVQGGAGRAPTRQGVGQSVTVVGLRYSSNGGIACAARRKDLS